MQCGELCFIDQPRGTACSPTSLAGALHGCFVLALSSFVLRLRLQGPRRAVGCFTGSGRWRRVSRGRREYQGRLEWEAEVE